MVFKGVASGDQLDTAEGLIWDWLEGLPFGIKRDDWSTHTTTNVWDQDTPLMHT